jgi:hypothetical protein
MYVSYKDNKVIVYDISYSFEDMFTAYILYIMGLATDNDNIEVMEEFPQFTEEMMQETEIATNMERVLQENHIAKSFKIFNAVDQNIGAVTAFVIVYDGDIKSKEKDLINFLKKIGTENNNEDEKLPYEVVLQKAKEKASRKHVGMFGYG